RLIDLSPAAAVFAWRGADTPANRSQRIGRARYEVGVLVSSLRDQLHVAARVGVDGACRLAGNHSFPEFDVRDDCLVLGVAHNLRPSFGCIARRAKTEPQLRISRRTGLPVNRDSEFRALLSRQI